ncbi:MAG: thioredoxin family protein [Candidatus Syntrophonatronum acetioxidans]|uniref:Thioredoxin family protein n=1 Tax=Candidatus Syntrophonatronum acetioxidans TaxID=1795816 RepID=A0A424YIA7_9FIRM|nr:MAG: thioredoxin family protein [Candidatus Syntrophonatronum acetioxidans]
MEIKILGPGCRNCDMLEKAVKDALEELNQEAEVIKVTDMNEIIEHDIMMTPGLVINGRVKSFGKVPKKDEVMKWVKEETA